MARRYSRDNRGRFASGGTGATARGGRLKTASGKTRETKKRIIPSTESRKTGPKAFAASAESGRVNMPVKFGGEGQGYKTPRGKAAAAKSRAADAANKAAIRRSGLPTSGGAMRVKGGLKRNPGAAAKLANRTAPPKPTRAARTPKTGQQIVNANIRKVQNQKLRTLNAKIKEAGPNAAGLRLQKLQLQSNMTSTRPKRTPKQEAKEQASIAAAKGRVATMRRVIRARANKDRTADTRNTPGSAMKRRPSQKTTRANNLADRALSFYSNPTKALQAVKKNKPGFRLPRNMR
jgi:hypothetical protein